MEDNRKTERDRRDVLGLGAKLLERKLLNSGKTADDINPAFP